MCNGAKNVAGNAEQVCFYANRELKPAGSSESSHSKAKKKEPNISAPHGLKGIRLEVELHHKLHNTRVVGEGFCGIVECIAGDADETSDTRISNRIHGVDAARNKLRVVKDVERISSQLN